MKKTTIFKKFRFLLILIPLGIVIALLDKEVLNGFLSTSETQDHYKFLGILLLVVMALLTVILRVDKNSEE